MAKKSSKSEFVSGMGVGFEIVKALSDDVRARGGNDDHLRAIVTDKAMRGILADVLVGKLRVQEGGYRDVQALVPTVAKAAEEIRDLITVPARSAAELIAQAKTLGLTYLDKDLESWDFIRDEAGKTYEVLVWKPGREVVPATEVRAHFPKGFTGNTAAFIAWVTKHDPEGYYASIPEDDRLFADGGSLFAPNFFRAEADRKLGLYYDLRRRWCDYWSFVAFREVQA
jgi:hypothetical protein